MLKTSQQTKSPFLRRQKRTYFHTMKESESPSPSLAGQTAIVNQAVLLTPVHRSPAPSRGLSSVTFHEIPSAFLCRLLTVTVAGPLRLRRHHSIPLLFMILSPDFLLSMQRPRRVPATPDPIAIKFSQKTLIKITLEEVLVNMTKRYFTNYLNTLGFSGFIFPANRDSLHSPLSPCPPSE